MAIKVFMKFFNSLFNTSSITMFFSHIQVTSEKLTELVEVIPRAGPKFRLGMYFDTIHEVPEFDAIKDPEEGYPSCWETDTDLDDETGSFLFANLDGDSASVICLDEEEATQLLEKWRSNKHHQHNDQEQSISYSTRLPNHKPNPGSDGTYEQVEGDTQYDDHIYETIDDYVDQNQLSLNESADSNSSSPPHTPTRTHTTKIISMQPRKSVPLQKSKRSMTIPPAQTDSQAKFTRKYSDCTEYARLQHTERRHSQPITKNDKVFQEQIYSTTFTSHKATTQKSDYASLSRPGEKSKKSQRLPISIVLKHKGKSYVLPIGQTKAEKPRKQSAAGTHHSSPKHSANTTTQASHTSSSNLRHSPTATGPISCSATTLTHSHSMGFAQAYSTVVPSVQQQKPNGHGSPQRMEQVAPSGTPKRSKSRTFHQANSTNTATQIPTHLTHYGVI